MTIAFNTDKLKNQLSSKAAMVKAFRLKAKKISLRFDEIEDIKNLMELQTLPALSCRQLSNNPLGQWRLNVTSNFFMIFLLDESPVPVNDDGSVKADLVTKIRIIGFI